MAGAGGTDRGRAGRGRNRAGDGAAQPSLSETGQAAAILRAAGWRVACVDAGTPLQVAWQQLARSGRGQAAGTRDRGHPGGRGMNHRLTVTAAVAVILASVSIYPLIQGVGWFWIGVGAVIVAAAAGTITRLPTLHATVAAAVLALIVGRSAARPARPGSAGSPAWRSSPSPPPAAPASAAPGRSPGWSPTWPRC